MKKTPRISETEWEVMKVVWAQAPCAADQVIERWTRAYATWHPKTVKAFLNRLVKKGVLGFRKRGARDFIARWCGRASAWLRRASPSWNGCLGFVEADARAFRGAQETLSRGG